MSAVALGEPAPKAKAVTVKEPPSPEQVIQGASVAPGLKLDVWAKEPLLSNPVAFTVDNRGRAWVAETNRRKSSALDIRSFPSWIPDSLSFRSVEDRVAFLKKALPEGALESPKGMRDLNGDGRVDWHDLEVESELVRLVEDRSGKGVADSSRVVAQGFDSVATGVGAGIVTRGSEAWYICAPDVWRFRENGTKESILQGLGVHIAYSGHDCHGAKFGPDGRLYFSVADCSARIEVGGQVLAPPASGAVFRCWPDGSQAELYAVGLRNPQSLVFNELGDLFTGDNNADGGDKARWLHLVEGGDYGWRLGYQFLKTPKLGVWNSEGMWQDDAALRTSSILPPVAHVGHGPAGVAYYPGTGLPPGYEQHFFMADFPGGVRAFRLTQSGASYRAELPAELLADNSSQKMEGKAVWNLNSPDIAFAPGGGLYVLDCIDWIPGYGKLNKGRIFHLHSEEVDASLAVRETRDLLAGRFANLPEAELERLLAHRDYRVRLEVQWALAEKGAQGVQALSSALSQGSGFSGLHAVWGLGQLAQRHPEALKALRGALKHSDPEVRAQACKVVGENGDASDGPALAALLRDDAPRVRFFATQALRRVGSESLVADLLPLIERDALADAYIRHAAVKVFAALAKPESLLEFQRSPSEAVRLVAVQALRGQSHAGVSAFLADSSARVRLEAARAIYDAPVESELPKLAALRVTPTEDTALIQRVQAARHRLGGKENAERLLSEALDQQLPESARIAALVLLRQWKPEDGRDVFLGKWWPLAEERNFGPVRTLLVQQMSRLLGDRLPAVRLAAVEMAAAFEVQGVAPLVRGVLRDAKAPGNLRAAALMALSKISGPGFAEDLESALKEKDRTLLDAAKKLLGKLPPGKASQLCGQLMESGSVPDVQSALPTLVQLKTKEGDAILERWMDKLQMGKVMPAVMLDVLEAAAKRGTPALLEKVRSYQGGLSSEDPLAAYRECLEGGDPKAGLEVFREKDEVGCYRCHKAAGNGGDVGPDMAGIGSRASREYLLRAILYPNADYAPGFETVLLTLNSGSVVAGMLESETETKLVLTLPGTKQKQSVSKPEIVKRERLPSPMPEGLGQLLTKREIRDLVEFLARQK
ncbi:MAG: hypothetical protein RLZZ399_130 [Verrucomicrobiota bacterium]